MANKAEIMRLKAHLQTTLADINRQDLELEKLAKERECEPWELVSYHGEYMMTPLLVAKASVLNGLAILSKE